jgi:uncharacterized membrane protein required for colicin V production
MSLTLAQTFDVLLALVLVMFAPLGLWRGALREWLTLAGVLLGAALAAEWAAPLGDRLAARAGLDPKVAAFTVAALFFALVTLLVGYGIGATLPYRADLSWLNRLLGALLGFGNGLLIVGSALRIIERNLFDNAGSSTLMRSALARTLVQSVGAAQLGLLGVLLLGLLAALIWKWSGQPPLFEEYAPAGWRTHAATADDRADGAAPDAAPDVAGEAEAEPGRIPAEGDTQILPPVAPVVVREIVDTTAPAPGASQATVHAPAAGVNGAHPTPPPIAPAAGGGDATTTGAAPPPVAVHPPGANGVAPTAGAIPASTAPDPATISVTTFAPPAEPEEATMKVCAICGTAIALRARFCPTCGHLSGKAERRAVARLS